MAYKNNDDQKDYARKHYLANKKLYLKRAKAGKKKSIYRNREYVFDILKNSACVDCGEDNPVVLEFDHDKSQRKRGAISNLISHAVSIKVLKTEISKCMIRCANCHRIKTAQEENWWIYTRVKND